MFAHSKKTASWQCVGLMLLLVLVTGCTKGSPSTAVQTAELGAGDGWGGSSDLGSAVELGDGVSEAQAPAHPDRAVAAILRGFNPSFPHAGSFGPDGEANLRPDLEPTATGSVPEADLVDGIPPAPLSPRATGNASPVPPARALPSIASSKAQRDQSATKDAAGATTPAKGFTRETVYFATDRARSGKPAADEFYTSKRGDLEYGMCQVSVPYIHSPGKLESPFTGFTADPRKHIVLADEIQSLDPISFMNSIRDRLSNATSREALVFVHGYNVNFAHAVRRTAQLSYDLNFPGAAICYTWPAGNFGNYNADWTNAEWTIPHCVQFLKLVARATSAEKIHVVAHSMGSRVLTISLKELLTDPKTRNLAPLFHQIVLAAPDLDAEVFRTQLVPAIRQAGRRMTVYTARDDRALQLSADVNGYTRLGSGGMWVDELKQIAGIEFVDATNLFDESWFGLKHAYYGDSPTLIHDLRSVLAGRGATERGLKQVSHGEYELP